MSKQARLIQAVGWLPRSSLSYSTPNPSHSSKQPQHPGTHPGMRFPLTSFLKWSPSLGPLGSPDLSSRPFPISFLQDNFQDQVARREIS